MEEAVAGEGRHRQRGGGRDATRSDPGRAIAFSDAIIAIVITLLGLDLRPPESEPGGLLTALLAEWPTYLALRRPIPTWP
ncbi:MAG TPA: TMEM175 family protein [Microbacterium sp.]|uniref:TMEM175 family protein n=1 Tax=Microbacterium sp. TaxID=51671 RepID=UPI002F93AAF7